ncbi:DEAD/DEAH box helicase family protein [Protaetiibacter sp. SSC-01]|uniref:DEAD/DEAH box helicase family protein n=1 Tax=Protaetiibacter sp. SSC-01 TaxID=2759943 RepID=UPI001657021F|nr:DEAD/DEAH box helicase family protein [Protaetiibacter sp. SSC-01]QNO37188.1 DEAD/DEAH box helicase family protein [Protaetiibacter sp. SSC-01]
MTTLPVDDALIDEIAAAMDLRGPNHAALRALVDEVARGGGREVIADLATGVGKTYLAAALVEYLARVGVRDVLIVVPGSTIEQKTIANFTPGHPKHISGATIEPLLITADNFQRGTVGDALHDRHRLKLYVFTVQMLLRPRGERAMRARKEDEYIGGALYEHLQDARDLVVIADEHHVYRPAAQAFSDAIRELRARAIVGLTATPDPADVKADKVVFRYPLAHAIADGYVKIPVIVYRSDDHRDERTQLADAVRLRDYKEPSWHAYADGRELSRVTPVLFVVCQDIAHAQETADALSRDYLPEKDSVLLITSESSDRALELLASVEAPTSPVRAIVSVNKLKEGWDVKNIGVIVALRRLASETLTEQILGRGLRLPFGERTGVPAIDQVDIVAHDSYRELLRNKDALLESLVGDRSGGGIPGSVTVEIHEAESAAAEGAERSGESAPAGLTITVRSTESLDGVSLADILLAIDQSDAEGMARSDADSVTHPTPMPRNAGLAGIPFPREELSYRPPAFSLASLDLLDVEARGRRFRTEPGVSLVRIAVAAERDLQGAVTVGEQRVDSVDASVVDISAEEVRARLAEALDRTGLVAPDLTELARLDDLVDAFLRGAGVTSGEHYRWSGDTASLAEDALTELVAAAYRGAMARPARTWDPVEIPEARMRPTNMRSKWDEFRKGAWAGPWSRSIEQYAAFDSATAEWALAHKLDSWEQVERWQRLYTQRDGGQAWITRDSGQRYYPDFVAVVDGEHWLLEAKSDRDEHAADVVEKAAAAEAWILRVNASRSFGVWHYLLVTEAHIAQAKDWPQLVRAARA